MELEYKYYVPSTYEVEAIVDNPYWRGFHLTPWTKVLHKARYLLDQEDILSKHFVACRLRLEKEGYMLCFKKSQGPEGTLSHRIELNFPWNETIPTINECKDLLSRSDDPDAAKVLQVLNLIKEDFFSYVLVADCLRYETLLEEEDLHVQVTVDRGELSVKSHSKPCYELEVEYLSGDLNRFHSLAQDIQEVFGLLAPTENKFSRLHAMWNRYYA